MMLSLAKSVATRNTLTAGAVKLAASSKSQLIRAASSVVPKLNLPDVQPRNEPILEYRKGSKELKDLQKALEETAQTCEEIPIVIGGQEFRSSSLVYQVMPHDHNTRVAKFYYADEKLIKEAIKTAVNTQVQWDRISLEERVKIWERAADLMAGKYRAQLNAATMLGQSKTVIQAEIDAAAELIDFIR